nr:immunoglobulin light chain junction region [Macaca mulatta]
CMQGLELPYSF